LEIHAPHRPIHTAKEMKVDLGLITLGVLIALSFEGLVAIQNLTRALAAIALLKHAETATVRELEDWKMTLRLTIASLEIEEQLGGGLLKEYERMLQGHEL
jgi:hypothetical protein